MRTLLRLLMNFLPLSTMTKHNRPLLYLRSTLYWVCSIINTIVMGAPVLLLRLVSYEWSARMSVVWLKVNLWSLKTFCGVTWNVHGTEHIPDYPCLVMSKHQSTWETYFLPTVLPRSVYVAKKSLSYIPIMGWSIVALNFIMIDRSSGRSAISQMVEQARERFADGISVIIFPEGTRMPVGAEPNYRIGGPMVAAETGVDVLPVATNAGEFWPRMGFIKWPGEITTIFGPVIKTEGKSAEVIRDETQNWIEAQMKNITVLNRFPY